MTTVLSLTRYPVKSLVGEDVPSLPLDARGCVGDRLWSVRSESGRIGSGKTTRRFDAVPGLLGLRGLTTPEGVAVRLPDGSVCPVASAGPLLSQVLGVPVTTARETDVSHFDDGPVSLLGMASVQAVSAAVGDVVDPSRFRANLVLDTDEPFVEEQWVGRHVRVGTAVLAVTMVSPRCVMVDMGTADLPAQPGVLRAVGRIRDACLGVIATVVTPGLVTVGDAVTVAH